MKKKITCSLNPRGCEEEIKKIKKKSKLVITNSRIQTIKEIKNSEFYLCSANIKVDKKFLKNADKLKYIFTPSTGTDHIDVKELKKKKIKLFHIAKEYSLIKTFTATSELSFGLLLSLLRKINIASEDAKNGKWSREKFSGNQLFGKTIGLIGYGRLGNISAKIAKGFGMKILVNDIKKVNKKNIKQVSLNKLLKLSDFVFLHIHLTTKTNKLLNKSNMKYLKKSAIIVNTSRGKIIDEDYLLYQLKNKKIQGACLDVIDGEWLEEKKLYNHKLIKFSRNNSNLLIVPHIGGSTEESIIGARKFMFNKILNYIHLK